MSRYILVPFDDGENLTIQMPKGLVCNDLFDELKTKVADEKRLQWLIKQMALHIITEDNEGVMVVKDKKVPNVNFRQALIDTCNDVFLQEHEQFYEILRKFNITF